MKISLPSAYDCLRNVLNEKLHGQIKHNCFMMNYVVV